MQFFARTHSEDGFTLIELLVVILVIGILAAIAIPSFAAQRHKGQDTCAKSMAVSMQKAIFTRQTDPSTSSTLNMTLANLTTIDPSINNARSCITTAGGLAVGRAAAAGTCSAPLPTATLWCVRATSRSGNIFTIQRAANGQITRVCTRTQTRGACRGTAATGTW